MTPHIEGRVLSAIRPLRDAHALLLAGAHALQAHGLTARPHPGLTLVTPTPRHVRATGGAPKAEGAVDAKDVADAVDASDVRDPSDVGDASDAGDIGDVGDVVGTAGADADADATDATDAADAADATGAADAADAGDTVDAIVRALLADGLPVAPHRNGLLVAGSYEVSVIAVALRHPPVAHEPLPVVALDDAVGLAVRALHDRGLARDVIDVASAAHLYSFLELEGCGRAHHDSYSVHELLMRLEFVEEMDDERLDGEIRRLVLSWIDEIKLRRAEEGDIDADDPDLPGID
ncbi:MAG: hypothetical protein HOV86_06340 [Thermoactinospora sp.]|nr:hypothetical protein [Thermoactinospora sp.]